METQFAVKKSYFIRASQSSVWDMLTNPDQIKKYLYGTHVTSGWKAGSPINFSGTWDGKEYLDKGMIQKLIKEKVFQYTYLSSFSGLPDIQENYSLITFHLSPEKDGTRLDLIQENILSEEECKKCEQNWDAVIKTLQELAENK